MAARPDSLMAHRTALAAAPAPANGAATRATSLYDQLRADLLAGRWQSMALPHF